MAVTYTNAVKIARMAALVSQAGTTAVLELTTSGGSILATVTLNNPIAGAATGAGVLTLSGFPKTVAATATGTVALARIRTAATGGGVDLITGLTVATSGADIIVDNTSVNSGQNVTVTASPTITHST